MNVHIVTMSAVFILSSCALDHTDTRRESKIGSESLDESGHDETAGLSLAGDRCSVHVNYTYEGYRLLQALKINNIAIQNSALARMQQGFDSCSSLSPELANLKQAFIRARTTIETKPDWCQNAPFNGKMFGCVFYELSAALYNFSYTIDTSKCIGRALLQSSRVLLHGQYESHFTAFDLTAMWRLRSFASAQSIALEHYGKMLSAQEIINAGALAGQVSWYLDQLIKIGKSPSEYQRNLYAEILANARQLLTKSPHWNPSCQ
jgi:hypothetical protein